MKSFIEGVRKPILDDIDAALSGRPRGPDLVIVERALRSPDRDALRAGIALLVDRALALALSWFDEGDGKNRATDYLTATSPAIDRDPYLAMYAEDVREAIEAAPPERLRQALASILETLPQIGGLPDVVRMLRTNDMSARRRLIARLKADQAVLISKPSRDRDVLEAAILASNDDASYALTRGAFRVVAAGYVTPDALEDLLRRDLT
jgi:hypothetical protein